MKDIIFYVPYLFALAGLACFAWPVLWPSSKVNAPKAGAYPSLKSPLWWVGFLLTIIAITLLRQS